MAGAFGFERDHYEISMRAGERVILPKVREASPETLIIADGFSCREQIAQATDRQGLHFAQVLQLALCNEKAAASPAAHPERQLIEEKPTPGLREYLMLAGAALGLAAASVFVLRRLMKRSRRTAEGPRSLPRC